MINFIKHILVVSTLFLVSAAFANNNDYNANYYEDEGSLLFKIRGLYVNAPVPINTKPITSDAIKPGDLVQLGYGFDTAVTYFLTDNIATELSMGLSLLKTKSSSLQRAATAYGNGAGSVGKNNNIFFIPATAIVQYHVAPFGAVRPYAGLGYHAAYLYTRSKAMKINPGHGAVVQAGIDFVAQDDSLITFDVRQYFLQSKVRFNREFLYPGDTAKSAMDSKVNLNPLVISFGIGFKF